MRFFLLQAPASILKSARDVYYSIQTYLIESTHKFPWERRV